MRLIIEILSWFTGRRIWVLLASKIAEKEGNYKLSKDFDDYAERLRLK